MLWVKISKEDYSVTEGEWTLSNAKLMAVGERDMDNTYPERNCRCCMRGGYLYVPAYTGKGCFTIVQVKAGAGSDAGWGKLKSGAGWIALDF